MTGEQLKEELARIAEGAPEVHVPHDLFTKGRRATVRSRVLVAAAAVACIGLIAGVAVPLVTSDDASVADSDELAVPDHIYAEDQKHPGPDLPLTPLDEVGRLVATYVTDDGTDQVVAITGDWDYRRIRLPGMRDPGLGDASPLLSPDGLHLAYASTVDGRWGVSLVDLTTGEVTDIRLTDGLGAIVRTMQWSPDSRAFVWSGQEVASTNQNGASFRGRIVGGQVLARERVSRVLSPGGSASWDGVGMCNTGTVVRYVWPVYLLGPDGRDRTRSWPEVQREHGPCAAPAGVVQIASSGRLLGWLPAEPGDGLPTAVVLEPDRDDDDGSWSTATLGLLTPSGSVDAVGIVDLSAIDTLSVATGGMSADRPTIPAGENPWARPWLERNRGQLAILLVLGLGLGVLLLVWRVRRSVQR